MFWDPLGCFQGFHCVFGWHCFWVNPRAFVVFLVPLGSFQGWRKVFRSISRVFGSTYLVPATLTGLQAGQDLAFYSWYPWVPLLQAGSLKVPWLSSEWHNDKICILFICRQKGSRTEPSGVSMWRMERWSCRYYTVKYQYFRSIKVSCCERK